MRYKVTLAYDGSYFHGFQRQTNLISVQEVLETELSRLFEEKIIVHASGRTDAFVHAKGQVIHFDSEKIIPEIGLKKVLNKKIYPHIYIKKVEFVNNLFHAQKSAIKKEYRYYVSINEFDPFLSNYRIFYHDRIDISKIREAMKYIIGTHDFKATSKNQEIKNTIRTIYEFELNINDDVLEFRIVGNGFMHNMVRIIIALMLKVGEGRLMPSDIEKILLSKERKNAPWVAPAAGLYLYEVTYDHEYVLTKE